MKDDIVVLTEAEKLILKSYSEMAESLSAYLGEGYEIVIHSLENYEHSAIKVINGFHTGRTEGAPITNLALRMLEKIKKQSSKTQGLTYFAENKNGEPLKSATITIRGENDRIIGLLCINFYMNTPFIEYMKSFIPQAQEMEAQNPDNREYFSSNSVELLEDIVEQVRQEVINDFSVSTQNKNKEIVQKLYNRGVFNIKDAVARTSALLGISKNTVYLHLRNLEKDK